MVTMEFKIQFTKATLSWKEKRFLLPEIFLYEMENTNTQESIFSKLTFYIIAF